MSSVLSQIQATSASSASSMGSGLDITAIVSGIITADSTKLNALKAKSKANTDTVNLDNTTMSQISSVKDLFSKVVSATNATTPSLDTITTAMTNFVSGLNSLISIGKSSNDRDIKDAISSFKIAVSGGKSTGNDSYSIMAQLGLSTNRDGTVSFDSTKFQDAYNNDTTATNTLLTKVASDLAASSDKLTGYNSPLQIRNTSLTNNNTDIAARLVKEQDRLDKETSTLYSTYSKMDSAVAALNSLGQNLTKMG